MGMQTSEWILTPPRTKSMVTSIYCGAAQNNATITPVLGITKILRVIFEFSKSREFTFQDISGLTLLQCKFIWGTKKNRPHHYSHWDTSAEQKVLYHLLMRVEQSP